MFKVLRCLCCKIVFNTTISRYTKCRMVTKSLYTWIVCAYLREFYGLKRKRRDWYEVKLVENTGIYFYILIFFVIWKWWSLSINPTNTIKHIINRFLFCYFVSCLFFFFFFFCNYICIQFRYVQIPYKQTKP